MGEPNHIRITFGSLPLVVVLPTNLVTLATGRLHTCLRLNCCETQNVRSTCYQAHHTIHSQKISFGSWLHKFHVDFHGMTYAHFVNYLHRPEERTPHHWITWRLTVRDELLSSGTTPYVQHGRFVPDVVLFELGKDINILNLKFATPAYVIRSCDRPFYEWTDVDFS